MKRIFNVFVRALHATNLHNHEAWHECRKCGKWFDRYLYGDDCPDCGTNVNAMP